MSELSDKQNLELILHFDIGGFDPCLTEGAMKPDEQGRYTFRSTANLLKDEVFRLQKQLKESQDSVRRLEESFKDSVSKNSLRSLIDVHASPVFHEPGEMATPVEYINVNTLRQLLGDNNE